MRVNRSTRSTCASELEWNEVLIVLSYKFGIDEDYGIEEHHQNAANTLCKVMLTN